MNHEDREKLTGNCSVLKYECGSVNKFKKIMGKDEPRLKGMDEHRASQIAQGNCNVVRNIIKNIPK